MFYFKQQKKKKLENFDYETDIDIFFLVIHLLVKLTEFLTREL